MAYNRRHIVKQRVNHIAHKNILLPACGAPCCRRRARGAARGALLRGCCASVGVSPDAAKRSCAQSYPHIPRHTTSPGIGRSASCSFVSCLKYTRDLQTPQPQYKLLHRALLLRICGLEEYRAFTDVHRKSAVTAANGTAGATAVSLRFGQST